MKVASDELSKPYTASARPAAASATPAASGAASPAASRPNREVFGFVQAGALGPSSGRGWNTYDYSLLTTVAYFGLHVNSGDGNLVQVANGKTETGWGVWNSNDVGDMYNAAKAAGARVVLTIVSQENASNMCQSLLHGSNTIGWAVQQMRARNFDGINLDYESGNGPCNGSDNRTLLRSMVANLRAQMDSDGVHHHLTVDTYAGSAVGSGDFYDVGGMAPFVDAFFVMAYPLDDSNWGSPPLSCSRYCFSPTSPASAYRYNDDLVAQQYSAVAGAAKTILGLPYFGYAACVDLWNPNAYPSAAPHWTVPTMWTLDGIATAPGISNYAEHLDVHDGVSRFATYHGSGND
ncbi:MAG: glycosyl hydrolase family 18 protein, partial [Chloroflexota bacterium]